MNEPFKKQKTPTGKPLLINRMLMQWLGIIKLNHPHQYNEGLLMVEGYIKDYIDQYKRALPKEGVLDTVTGFYGGIDTMFEKHESADKEKISCRRGCDHCCRIRVEITGHEAIYLLEVARRSGTPINTDYLKMQTAYATPGEFARGPVAACVFLKNHECSIYAARPSSCRKYFVATPPKDCDASKGPVQVGMFFDLHSECIDSAMANMAADSGPMAEMLLKYSNVFEVYPVYDHPTDFPNDYIVRRHAVYPGGVIVIDDRFFLQSPDLELVRRTMIVDMGKALIARDPAGDPKILETYL